MSVTQHIEAVLQGPASRDVARELRRRILNSLARQQQRTLSVPGALYLIQGARCFHCDGYMPLFAKRIDHGMASRDHALPAGVGPSWTYPVAAMRAAVVMAHKLCNAERRQRPFTLDEWQRAGTIWRNAEALWLQSGGATGHPFIFWIDLANRMQQETT